MSNIMDLHEFIELVSPVKLHPYQQVLLQSLDLEAGTMFPRKPCIHDPKNDMYTAIAKAAAIHHEHPELKFSRESIDQAAERIRSRNKRDAFIENYGTSEPTKMTQKDWGDIREVLSDICNEFNTDLGSEEDA